MKLCENEVTNHNLFYLQLYILYIYIYIYLFILCVFLTLLFLIRVFHIIWMFYNWVEYQPTSSLGKVTDFT